MSSSQHAKTASTTAPPRHPQSSDDKGLTANKLSDLHGMENKSKNSIVGCKDREKIVRNEIWKKFSEKH